MNMMGDTACTPDRPVRRLAHRCPGIAFKPFVMIYQR